VNQQVVKIFVSVAIRDGDRVLLVQEEKQDSIGLWNLPGGHLEIGETLQAGAAREVKEETGLEVSLSGLIGAYTWIRVEGEQVKSHSIRVVFSSRFEGGEPYAGDQILTVKWATLDELAQTPDAELLSPRILKDVAARMKLDIEHPLNLLNERRLHMSL
jgi:8-oxo-dGTP diphosphatase